MPPRAKGKSRSPSPIDLQLSSPQMFHYSPSPRQSRETTPIDTGEFKNIIKNLKPGQYATLHDLPERPINTRHYLRRAALAGLLGLGSYAAYRFRQPLLKLGQQAYNYGLDKFHNLFGSTNSSTNSTAVAEPNPHNW